VCSGNLGDDECNRGIPSTARTGSSSVRLRTLRKHAHVTGRIVLPRVSAENLARDRAFWTDAPRMGRRNTSPIYPLLTAVAAALSESWSNEPTEGYITKLKLLCRQMYGRGKLDLLRARLIAPA
jgi:hypothetical protein